MSSARDTSCASRSALRRALRALPTTGYARMARRIRRLHEEHRLRIRETHGLGLLLGLTFTAHFCAQPYGHLTPWLASRYGERPPRGIRRRRGGDGIWRFAIRTPPAGAVPTSSRHAFRRGRSAAVTHSLTQTHSHSPAVSPGAVVPAAARERAAPPIHDAVGIEHILGNAVGSHGAPQGLVQLATELVHAHARSRNGIRTDREAEGLFWYLVH